MKNLYKYLQRLHIRSQKRFTLFTTTYPGFKCTMVDKSSFLFMYEEIFKKEIYKFEADNSKPFIIDAGANIGLATIYFKKLFPEAELLAFEPDPNIYKILEKNIISAQIETNTKCIKAAISNEESEVIFSPDGADGGNILAKNSSPSTMSVQAVRLDSYITKPVDFLKIDIEGAEYNVINSISEKLHLIKNIFVEYHSFADQPQHLDDILSKLKASGFRYYIEHIGIRSDFPYLIRNTHYGMDMQINIYGYRN